MGESTIIRKEFWRKGKHKANILESWGHLRSRFLLEEVSQALVDHLHVVVDFTKLRSVDDEGLLMLIKVQKMCEERGVSCKIVVRQQMEDHIKELMPDGNFTFYRNAEKAKDSFA